MPYANIHTYTDGGSRGNPGPAAIGGVLQTPDGRLIEQFGQTIGEATNNQAEYGAIIEALTRAKHHGATRVTAHLDSELVVRQLTGAYKVKHVNMRPLFAKVQLLARAFEHVEFHHVPREENEAPDTLLNAALDGFPT